MQDHVPEQYRSKWYQTWRVKATVQPGGKIVIVDESLPVGETMDVVVERVIPVPEEDCVDILTDPPPAGAFKTAAEVTAHLNEEKASWDR